MDQNNPQIKIGDYIIIQRQKYTKLHKLNNVDSTAFLGKEQIELRNIEGHKFYSTFKMIPKEGKKRISSLEICTESDMKNIQDVLGIKESGLDNRNIIDDGGSQGLKPEEIEKLREEYTGSAQLIEKIVENSKSFTSKTEYSQAKYLKKKEKKYFEFVQIRQPNIRLLAQIYYRQDPEKIMGIRIDTLSQILSHSGVCGYGNYLLYESGTCGLIPAAVINAVGAGTEAKIVHMHPGNISQRQAILALNLPEEQSSRCVSVNIYSVLREFHQNFNKVENRLEKRSADSELESEVPCKTLKLELGKAIPQDAVASVLETDEVTLSEEPLVNQDVSSASTTKTKAHAWQVENLRACELMKEKFDALIITAREHPTAILKALLPFLKPSRPVVVFSLSREILMEVYVELKASFNVTSLHLTSNWMRMYQILPNRTHPEVNMNGSGGYLLHGFSTN